MRTKRFGFTIVELLTSVAIIAMLVAILIPSLSMVRNFAKETRQKAHFAAIGQALMAFRNDYGDYPPSEERDMSNPSQLYCGAQKLAEAILGWDLLGFQPRSQSFTWNPNFRSDGLFSAGGTYDPTYLDERRGPYLDVGTANAFTLGQLFYPLPPIGLTPERYVLCDCFPVKKVTIGPVGSQKTVKAGTPILYYRAYTQWSQFTLAAAENNRSRYNYYDNAALCAAPPLKGDLPHWLRDPELFYREDYKIVDLQVFQATQGVRLWPHRPDSYILISAGADGLYGTPDDITNFGN